MYLFIYYYIACARSLFNKQRQTKINHMMRWQHLFIMWRGMGMGRRHLPHECGRSPVHFATHVLCVCHGMKSTIWCDAFAFIMYTFCVLQMQSEYICISQSKRHHFCPCQLQSCYTANGECGLRWECTTDNQRIACIYIAMVVNADAAADGRGVTSASGGEASGKGCQMRTDILLPDRVSPLSFSLSLSLSPICWLLCFVHVYPYESWNCVACIIHLLFPTIRMKKVLLVHPN